MPTHRKPVPVVPPKKTLGQRLKSYFTIASQLPTKWVVVLALVDGVVTVLNQATFDFGTTWKTTITALLGLFAFLGIGPILGPKFKAMLHLPAAVGTAIGVGLIVLMVFVQQNAGMPERAIIIGVINVAGGLGFAPVYVPTLAA